MTSNLQIFEKDSENKMRNQISQANFKNLNIDQEICKNLNDFNNLQIKISTNRNVSSHRSSNSFLNNNSEINLSIIDVGENQDFNKENKSSNLNVFPKNISKNNTLKGNNVNINQSMKAKYKI